MRLDVVVLNHLFCLRPDGYQRILYWQLFLCMALIWNQTNLCIYMLLNVSFFCFAVCIEIFLFLLPATYDLSRAFQHVELLESTVNINTLAPPPYNGKKLNFLHFDHLGSERAFCFLSRFLRRIV